MSTGSTVDETTVSPRARAQLLGAAVCGLLSADFGPGWNMTSVPSELEPYQVLAGSGTEILLMIRLPPVVDETPTKQGFLILATSSEASPTGLTWEFRRETADGPSSDSTSSGELMNVIGDSSFVSLARIRFDG